MGVGGFVVHGVGFRRRAVDRFDRRRSDVSYSDVRRADVSYSMERGFALTNRRG